jgi:hypothetical protein
MKNLRRTHVAVPLSTFPRLPIVVNSHKEKEERNSPSRIPMFSVFSRS